MAGTTGENDAPGQTEGGASSAPISPSSSPSSNVTVAASEPRNPASPDRGIAHVTRAISSLRRTAWLQLIVQRVGVGLAVLFAAALVVGLLDFVLRMPMALRAIFWLGGVALAAWFIAVRLLPAWRFQPTLTDVALRLESTPAAKEAGLRGVLASGIELGVSSQASPGLASLSASEASRRFAAMGRSAGLLDRRRLATALGALALAALPIIILAAAAPSHTRIGFLRVATPWSSAAWPKRTQLASAGHAAAHARGTPVALRALLARSPRDAAQTQVEARYRTTIDGKSAPWRKAVLTWQGKRAAMTTSGQSPESQTREGELFEMLLDPGVAAGSDPDMVATLEYAFSSGDDETQVASILLVEPPSITAATAEITPPEYAAAVLAAIDATSSTTSGSRSAQSSADWTIGHVDLARARDHRSRIGPLLAGSRVELTLDFNKPLAGPARNTERAWLLSHLPALAGLVDEGSAVDVDVQDRRWRLAFTPRETLRIAIQPVDEHGITAREEHSVSLQVAPDAPASAAVIEPPNDESVLPSAVVEVIGEGRDDVSLASVALRGVLARAPAGSAGAAPEATTEWRELAAADTAAPGPRTLLRAASTLDIATLSATSGDEVWLRTAVRDVLGVATEAPEVLSLTRRLRVISEAEFVEQVRTEMSNLRESAKRLADAQAALGRERDRAREDVNAAAQQRTTQEALGDRMPPMADLAQRLLDRVDRNKLEDPSLRGMLTDAKEVIEEAREASDDAAAQLSALSSEASPEQRDAASKENQAAQERVEQALDELASMLDRGQDSWAVRRELERLLTEQSQVASQTAAAGESTRGRAENELTPKERDDLDRVARRQEEIAQRTAGLVEQMEARAEQMKQSDPGQAEAMRRAAQKARNERIAERQRDAAQQTRQNQTGAAQQQQEQAQEALEEMMEELERSDQRQDEALRRTLAELDESIRKLITQQEAELKRIATTIAGGLEGTGLDAGMIALHQNTLDVLGKAEAGKGPGVEKIASLIDSAAQSQSAATVSLRARELIEAEAHERASLSKLQSALEEISKQEEQAEERDAARQRAQLRKAYQELLEQQVAIKAETDPLVGKELSRRDRSQTRALSEQQSAIATTLEQLRSATQEIAESRTFELANRRLDEAARRAAAALGAGEATRAVRRDQATAVRVLQGLVESLKDPKKTDEFRDEQGGGGGGGGGGQGQKPPLIPPIAEIRLLRSMQGEAAELTRAAAEAAGADGAADLDAAAELQTELAEQARALMEKLKNESGAPDVQPPGAAEPAPEPGPAPAPGEEPAPAEPQEEGATP
jgi:hypothetical protein